MSDRNHEYEQAESKEHETSRFVLHKKYFKNIRLRQAYYLSTTVIKYPMNIAPGMMVSWLLPELKILKNIFGKQLRILD